MTEDEKRLKHDEAMKHIRGHQVAMEDFKKKVELLVEEANSWGCPCLLFNVMYELYKKDGYSPEEIERIVKYDLALASDWKACVQKEIEDAKGEV